MEPDRWELIYFAHPTCSGTCAHCWSSDTYLGRPMPLRWHRKFWGLVDPNRVREVRVTGGEPLEARNFAGVLELITGRVDPDTTVRVFTSGRLVVSLGEGEAGVAETIAAFHRAGLVRPGVEVNMSADEHHAGAAFRRLRKAARPPAKIEEARRQNDLGRPLLTRMVANFITACERLVAETSGAFRGGRLKVHVEDGRLDFHRAVLFGAYSDEWWRRYVDWSEGLIRSGRAEEWPRTHAVDPKPVPSLFIIPGAEFRAAPESPRAQAYLNPAGGSPERPIERPIYLDRGRVDGDGACVVGFWNLVAKTFCGGSAADALNWVGKPGATRTWHERPGRGADPGRAADPRATGGFRTEDERT